MNQGEVITISRAEYDELLAYKAKVNRLEDELKELKRLIFGSKRERYAPTEENVPEQGALFDLPEKEDKPAEKEKITYTRAKTQPKKQPLRTELPAHLPRREKVIEPSDKPEGARKIGEAVTEILQYEPAELYVERTVRPKFIKDTHDEHTEVTIAELPSQPIPKGNAGAGLLAHLLISKYVDHLPFYRLRKMFQRQGVDIAESTINGWFSQTCRLLEPLYESLKTKVLEQDYLMADETPLPVQTKDKPGATHKGYYWVYYSPEGKLALFDYRQGRGRDGPDTMLQNFRGYLQTDGYAAYENLSNRDNITLLACMAHGRRYFEKALDNDPERAEKALRYYQQLYAIERKARDEALDAQAVHMLRQREAVPVLQQMEAWMKAELPKVPPQHNIARAMNYNLKLWPRLKRYAEDGRLYIDNNLVENSIRPVALGRKNYLFAGSHSAAQNAAMIYSLLATCKMNDVEPFQWLRKTLSVLPDYPANRLQELLPGQK
jgi:transposase